MTPGRAAAKETRRARAVLSKRRLRSPGSVPFLFGGGVYKCITHLGGGEGRNQGNLV